MAKIALRAYLREIENLIERGQSKQAIAHSKYILKQFPKHVDTYRLLAKAYLEAQRYTEASDVFQRVLSVIPDDFLSHLGMSIIREDEGNLDQAIWHMERAFEVQPSNSAIQDELRRLYGRRDGAEPPRVRLTRGALVRMYARGELYPQAIAEARAALSEDPSRIDLEVMLARAYLLAGQKVEATELAGRLMNRLPFSLDANRILAEILPGTQRAEDARTFQRNLAALDPYTAFLSESTPRSEMVPDNAIMLEKLDYDEEMATNQPDWAETVGIELDSALPDMPDWINSASGAPVTSAPASGSSPSSIFSEEEMDTSAPEEAEVEPTDTTQPVNVIPDWMREAGWQEGSGAVDESKNVFDETLPEQEELAPAELPDWLKDLSPDTSEGEAESEMTDEDRQRLAMLDELLPAARQEPSMPGVEGFREETNMTFDHEPEEPVGSLPSEEKPEDAASADLPDWLSELAGEIENDKDAAESQHAPDWLPSTQAGETASQDEVAAPEWLSSITDDEPVTPAQDRAPDWLSSIAEDTSTSGEEQPRSVQSESLDWLASSEEQASEEKAEQAAESDWFSDLLKADQPSADQPAEPAAESEAPLPEWLAETLQADALTEGTAQEEPLPSVPDFVNELPAEEGELQPEESAQPLAAEEMDLDSAMAWLEGLAARQGAESEELLTRPEDRLEATPDWLKEMADEEEPEIAPDAVTLQVEQPRAAEQAETPVETTQLPEEDSLQAVSPVPDAEQIEAAAQIEKTIEAAEFTPTEEGIVEQPSADLYEAQPGPESTAEEEIAAAGALVYEVPETSVEPAAPTAEPVAGMEMSEDMDEAMAWLESLAAKQGADAEELLTQPEERVDAPPQWIQEASAEMETPTEVMSDEQIGKPEGELDLEALTQLPEEGAYAEEVPLTEGSGEIPAVELDEVSEAAESIEELPAEGEPEKRDFAWFEDLASSLPEQAEEFINAPVAAESTEGEVVKPLDDIPPAEMQEQAAEGEEKLPTWLQELSDEEVQPTAAAETLQSEGVADETGEAVVSMAEIEVPSEGEALPDWLEDLIQSEASEEQTSLPVDEIETSIPSGMNEWEAESSPIDEQPADTTPEAVVQLPEDKLAPDFTEEQAVQAEPSPDWMLAAEQEAPADEEDTQPLRLTPAAEIIEEPSEIEAAVAQEAELVTENELTEAAPTPAESEPEIKPVDTASRFENARQALDSGKIDEGVEEYSTLIEEGQMLEEITHELRTALYRYPVDISLWQLLGDAFLRQNKIQDALDSYTKAEELLK